jgi:hypothetical protein
MLKCSLATFASAVALATVFALPASAVVLAPAARTPAVNSPGQAGRASPLTFRGCFSGSCRSPIQRPSGGGVQQSGRNESCRYSINGAAIVCYSN